VDGGANLRLPEFWSFGLGIFGADLCGGSKPQSPATILVPSEIAPQFGALVIVR